MSGNSGVRLEHVVARNITELRRQRGWSQATLAALMTDLGLKWSTNRATQVETLRRPVGLLEVVGLAWVFEVPVTDLLTGDDDVALPSGATAALADVRAGMAGKGQQRRAREVTPRPAGELRRVAGTLRVPEAMLEWLSRRRWGRGFIDEREARLGDLSGVSPRSAQTKRGHVTRGLVQEMAEWLDADRRALTAEWNQWAKSKLDAVGKGGGRGAHRQA